MTSAESWKAPRMYPTTYPGAAPAGHYLLLDGEVCPVELGGDGSFASATLSDGRLVDDVLASLGLDVIEDRVPVLAYGANRNPHTLALKLDHHDAPEHPHVAVPVLRGVLRGHDVVVSGFSSQGCVYADMWPSPATSVEVHLTLLDHGQAAAIHRSEALGEIYDCALVDGFSVDGSTEACQVLAYAGRRAPFVSPLTSSPVAFARIEAHGRVLPAMDQLDAFAHVLEASGTTGRVAALVGARPDAPATEVARHAAAVVNGAWWHAHHTGSAPNPAARAVTTLLQEAVDAHRGPVAAAAGLREDGRVLPPEAAFASGPHLSLRSLRLG